MLGVVEMTVKYRREALRFRFTTAAEPLPGDSLTPPSVHSTQANPCGFAACHRQ
jgi:hypothetical protein